MNEENSTIDATAFTKVPEKISNEGTSIEQSRALQEAQGQLILAKKFPRSEMESHTNIMKACNRFGLAEKAMYNYPRGKKTVSGPTVVLLREIKKLYGNMESGTVILNQSEDVTEGFAYAWDLQSNTRTKKYFFIKHERKADGIIKKLFDPRDIREIVENYASRYERSCIESVIPADLLEDAKKVCATTLRKGDGTQTKEERLKKLIFGFDNLGIKLEDLIEKMGHALDSINDEEFVELVGIFNSIKDGESKRHDWFKRFSVDTSKAAELNEKLKKEKTP